MGAIPKAPCGRYWGAETNIKAHGSKKLPSFTPDSCPLPLLMPLVTLSPFSKTEAEPVGTVSTFPLLLLSSHTSTTQTFLPPILYHAFIEVPPALLTGSTLVCCSWKHLYVTGQTWTLPTGTTPEQPPATKTLLHIPSTSTLSSTVDVRTC